MNGGTRLREGWRRWRQPVLVAAILVAIVLIGAGAFYGGGGWHFASELDEKALSAEARREALIPNYTIDVIEVEGDRVTLRKQGEERLQEDGVFGLQWPGGWGVIGEILGHGPNESVTRAFEDHGPEPLRIGVSVSLESRVYEENPLAGRGIAYQDVTFRGELGEYPAWFVPGEGTTWFVFVHGNSMTRLDGLRILPTAVAAGMPVLIPTYRNDEGAPADPGGRLTYGKHEWRDLEAAVQYALDQGAQSVVIEGVSMGGAVAVAFLLESPLASRVSGLILDAPVLSFERSVEHQAKDEDLPLVGLPLPGSLVDSAEWIATQRFDVDWGYTDYLDRIGELASPILLIHGGDDGKVPIATSEELAAERPDLVRDFYVVPQAGHVEAWNADPAAYEQRVRTFLADIGAIH